MWYLCYLCVWCIFMWGVYPASPPDAIDIGVKISESFDSLGKGATGTILPFTQGTTLLGWWSSEDQYIVSDGTSNVGGLYSFGEVDKADRSLGSITSNKKKTILFGISMKTEKVTKQLVVSFTGEQWRYGGDTPDTDSITFDYAIMSTSQYMTGGWGALGVTTLWSTVPALTITPNTSYTNNTVGPVRFTQEFVYTIQTPDTFGADKVMQLRWTDHNGRDGLAINNFEAIPSFGPTPAPPQNPPTGPNTWKIIAIAACAFAGLLGIALITSVVKLRKAMGYAAIPQAPQPQVAPALPITNIGSYGMFANQLFDSKRPSFETDVENRPLLDNNAEHSINMPSPHSHSNVNHNCLMCGSEQRT